MASKLIGLAFLVLMALPWVFNVVKFVECDFESQGNHTCEIIHGIGAVVPPASWITVWFDLQEGEKR